MTETSTPRALVLLAEGAEEMEVVITVDVLRRGGVEVVLAGVAGAEAVACSRGVRLVPDAALEQVLEEARGDFDLVVLPGGLGGTERLAASDAVGELLRAQEGAGRPIAALCAAPLALQAHGVGAGRAFTSHPSVREAVAPHGDYREATVVVDRGLTTSRGPGTAFAFALQLVEQLRGVEVARDVRAPMILGD